MLVFDLVIFLRKSDRAVYVHKSLWIWRKATVIAVPKPIKPKDDPKSYRPISLLCMPFKLLERMIHGRINPIIDPQLPHEKGWFPQTGWFSDVSGRSWTLDSRHLKSLEPNLRLMSLIQAWFWCLCLCFESRNPLNTLLTTLDYSWLSFDPQNTINCEPG